MGYKLELLYEVAELYYMEDLKQESIARRLKISKYKVNRVLKRAREQGMVQIKVIKSGYY